MLRLATISGGTSTYGGYITGKQAFTSLIPTCKIIQQFSGETGISRITTGYLIWRGV